MGRRHRFDRWDRRARYWRGAREGLAHDGDPLEWDESLLAPGARVCAWRDDDPREAVVVEVLEHHVRVRYANHREGLVPRVTSDDWGWGNRLTRWTGEPG